MVVLDTQDVIQLLCSEIERAGGPMSYSKKARVDRTTVYGTVTGLQRPSRKVINALDLRVVYARKQEKIKAQNLITQRTKEDSNIAIVPPAAGSKRDRSTPLLFFREKWARDHRAQVALLVCLYSELGRVVPYERLCRVIGHLSSQERQLHILRQHMLLAKRMLAAYKANCFIAVSAGIGYALCEVALA